MPYPYLGTSVRIYTQYLNGSGTPLVAAPGGSYDMAPAAGRNLPVPPADGNWGPGIRPARARQTRTARSAATEGE